jgi:hypothetical protein
MALVFQYENNAAGQLLAAITAVSTSCTLQSGQGSNFPTADGTATKFNVTLIKSTGEREICVCKRTAGSDVLTFIDVSTGAASVNGRAQEGTSALVFAAGDQVELRLTKGQVESFEEDIDSLQTSVTAIEADYLTDADHNPGGINEADHDARYYTQSQLWTRTELAAAGGGAPIDAEHLTGKDAISHSQLTDDEATKHRLINDSAGNGVTTQLWSANKIYDELALKSPTTHVHDKGNAIFTCFTPNSYGMGSATIGTNLYSTGVESSVGITGSNTSFGYAYSVQMAVYLTPEMTTYHIMAKVGNRNGATTNVRLRVVITDLADEVGMSSTIGTVRETGAEWTPTTVKDQFSLYESSSGTMTIPTDNWYLVFLEGRVVDATPSKFWAVNGFYFYARPSAIT